MGREVLRPVCTSEKVKGWGQDYQSASISPEDQRSDSKADFFFLFSFGKILCRKQSKVDLTAENIVKNPVLLFAFLFLLCGLN